MKIYLIRHGQTDWNIQGRFQGREDIPLNDTGIKQAVECGNALKGESFAAVITSPLIRARRTAEIIADILSVEQIIIEDKLIERDFSKISGMTPAQREAFYASGGNDNKEPWEDLCNRMMFCLDSYGDRFQSNNIIMVSHGASINAVLSVLSSGKTGTGKLILKNTCINIIDFDKKRHTLEDYNLSAKEYLARRAGNEDCASKIYL